MHSVTPAAVGVPLDKIDLNAVAADVERNPDYQKTIREVIDQIAHTAVLIESLLDPEVLILAGLICEFEEMIDALRTRINAIRPTERRGRTTTVRSQIGRNYRASVVVALQQLDPDIADLHRPTR